MEAVALPEEIQRATARLRRKRLFIAATKFIPDRIYLQMRARFMLYRLIQFEHPKRFTDKLQWLKCFDRSPLRSQVADKLRVRSIVEELAGDLLRTPDILRVYDHPEEFDGRELPDRYVLKSNHGSGMNLLIDGRESPPIESIQGLAREWLALDYHYLGREYHYQTQRRFYAEEYLGEGQPPEDYKLYCFNGRVRFIQVDLDRFETHRRIMLQPDWEHAGFDFIYPPPDDPPVKPPALNQMIDAAERLAQGFDFIRVDLYELGGRIYFGELTNFPESGFGKFFPDRMDYVIGSYLDLEGRV